MRLLDTISAGLKIQILQGVLCLLLAVSTGGAYLFGLKQQDILAHEAEMVTRLNRVSALMVGIKQVQIEVIQVQQFLTDISATRGLDGLNDGLDVAAGHAEEFRKRTGELAAEAKALGLEQIVAAFEDARAKFEPYYATGQTMAQSYVAQGPAGGNLLMGKFDETAQSIGASLELLTKVADEAAADSQNQALALQADSSTFLNMLMMIGAAALAVGLGAVYYTFRLQQSAKADSQRAAHLQRLSAEDQARKSETAALIIHELGTALDHLSRGNIDHRVTTRFSEEFDHLRSAYNTSVESLTDAIRKVRKGTDEISSGSNDVARASEDLARRTETQAANLEQTAAAVSEITTTVKKSAETAELARDLVQAAKADANDGGDVAGRAIEAMGQIRSSSAKINQIIGVIDEIAFQTNLLALNAGVEAARAGDAGRGFAVVASEVRALAQRSAEAAREIKQLLSTSQSQVESGVTLVSQTGTALQRIVSRIAEITSAIGSIAEGASHQSTGLQEVNLAVDQMDQVTQQNAAMVEEATAATHNLSRQTVALSEAVGYFSGNNGRRAA